MKFAKVIRAAGLDDQYYPNCSEINIRLYDGNREEITDETVEYAEPLFKNNSETYLRFYHYLESLESKLDGSDTEIKQMNVQISQDAVIVNYWTPALSIFFRNG